MSMDNQIDWSDRKYIGCLVEYDTIYEGTVRMILTSVEGDILHGNIQRREGCHKSRARLVQDNVYD